MDNKQKQQEIDSLMITFRDYNENMSKSDLIEELVSDVLAKTGTPLEDVLDICIGFMEQVKKAKPLTFEERCELVDERKFEFKIEVINPATGELSKQLAEDTLKSVCATYKIKVSDYLEYYRNNIG